MTQSTEAALRARELTTLRRVRDRIDREFSQPLDVAALARDVHLSAGHLSRRFRAAYGEPPYSYLMTRRIERAMTLLRRDELSVTDICFLVGFSSLGTVSTRFTELVGRSPSTYRKESAGATDGVPDMRWITVGPPGQPDTSVVLHPPTVDPGISDTERAAVADMMSKGTYAGLLLATDDLDAAFERIEASGAEIVQEPKSQDWGARDCAFRDPAGTLLRLQQKA